MGEVLWSPIWDFPQNGNMFRPYFKGHILGWQAGTTVIQDTNPIIVEEHTFGGYRVHLKLLDEWWEFGTGEWHVEDIVEDLYAIVPVSGDHVSLGAVTVGLGYSELVGYYWLNFQFAVVPEYLYFPIEQSSGGHWFDG